MFNQFDQPGRYLCLRDDDSGDFWSASWQPVGKDLAHYRSRCCHGMGYTRMLADAYIPAALLTRETEVCLIL